MISLLEIGPGDDPLVSCQPGWSDWELYEQGGLYTAVQPENYREWLYKKFSPYKFPEQLLTAPRVTHVDARIENANLPDCTFDMVYARDVIGDPGTYTRPIINHAARVAKIGGIITFLETCTPDEAPSIDVLANIYHGVAKLINSEMVQPVEGVDRYSIPPSVNWLRTMSPYSRHLRASRERSTLTVGSFFVQFQRI